MRVLRIAAALVFLSGIGCSLLLSTAEPMQCRSQRDCAANPGLRDRVCEEGFCVVPRLDPSQVSPPSEGCTSTDHCTQMNGGKASVCRIAGGTCTPLQTASCGDIRGDWKDPQAIFVGTILPFHHKQPSGPPVADPYASRVGRAIDLGLEELNAALPNGLPIAGKPRGHFAVLHCDSSLNDAGAREAMKHLTEVVGARAVIVGSDQDLAAVRAQALTSKTAVVCSDCIGPFAPGPFAWRIVPPLAYEAPMAAWRVGELEKQIKASSAPPAVLKVAVLSAPESAATAFVSALLEKLVFNGKPALENGPAFLARTTENPQEGSPVIPQVHAAAIVSFEPDVVVVAMGEDFPKHYLPQIEATWTSAKPKPHYVMTALSSNASPFASVIGSTDDLRRRLSGTRPVTDPVVADAILAYETRYFNRFNYERADGNFSGYDAFYATAYAIAGAAITDPVLDGPHIDAAFGRLRSGPAIEVGLTKVGTALELLGIPGASIDLHGFVTPLDWDVTTRELAMTETGLYCFERSGDGALVLRLNAGPRMNPSTGVVEGVYACN